MGHTGVLVFGLFDEFIREQEHRSRKERKSSLCGPSGRLAASFASPLHCRLLFRPEFESSRRDLAFAHRARPFTPPDRLFTRRDRLLTPRDGLFTRRDRAFTRPPNEKRGVISRSRRVIIRSRSPNTYFAGVESLPFPFFFGARGPFFPPLPARGIPNRASASDLLPTSPRIRFDSFCP